MIVAKKLFSILTILVLSIGLSACAKKENGQKNQYNGTIFTYKTAHSLQRTKTPVSVTFDDKTLQFNGKKDNEQFKFGGHVQPKTYQQARALITKESASETFQFPGKNGELGNATGNQVVQLRNKMPKATKYYLISTNTKQPVFSSTKVNWIPLSPLFLGEGKSPVYLLYKKNGTLYNVIEPMKLADGVGQSIIKAEEQRSVFVSLHR